MGDWRVLEADSPGCDGTRMLPELIAKLAEPLSRERQAFWSAMRGPEDVARRQQLVRARFREALGEFPERTPLNPQVVERREFPGYVLEKLVYESRPRLYVPANLYVPIDAAPPLPAVLVSCGHYENGKAAADYQRTGISLARKGCLAMIIDPLGEGERQEFFDAEIGKSILGGPVMEHHYAGDPGYLLGIPFPHHRVWDKMRGIDLIYGREDVDRRRMACVGHSGGGAMAVLMAAADERISLTVASSPGGSCEWTLLPGGVRSEESLADLLTLFAPRPLLIYYGEEEPGWAMAQRLEPLLGRVYAALGAPERFRVCATPGGHDHDRDKRERLYGWIDRWFLNGTQGAAEPEVEAQPGAAVQCTATGQVLTSLHGRALWEVHRDLATEIRPRRPVPRTRDDARAYQEEIGAAMRRRLGATPAPVELAAQVVDEVPAAEGRLVVERLAYTSEEGVRIPALFYRPAEGTGGPVPALVYIDERGKAAEAGPTGLLRYLSRRGYAVLAIDARGLGETALPGAPFGDGLGLTAHRSLFGHDAVHAVRAMSLGRPLFGMRVLDALRAVAYLRARADVDAARLRAAGHGMGGLIALYAGALDAGVGGVLCEEGLLSYQSVVSHREYAHFLNVFLPGVLKEYDLPDVAACLAPRPLLLLNPLDHARRWVEQERVEAEYDRTRQVYQALGAADRLTLRSTPPQHEAWRRELYRWWLGRLNVP